ncbi:MAG: hypothetical protein RIQ62_1814 [Bacteroidota bacterium]
MKGFFSCWFLCLIALMGLSLFSSCTQQSYCLDVLMPAMRSYYSTLDANGKWVDTTLQNPSVRFGANGNDLTSIQNSNGFVIPIPQAQNSFTIYFRTDSSSALEDTLQIVCEPYRQFISKACGYRYYATLQSCTFTRHQLDSVLVVHPSVNADITIKHLQFVIRK